MVNERTIICLSTIRWNFLWQRHQIFMSKLAEAGYRIFFIETLNPNPLFSPALLPKIVRWLAGLFSRQARGAGNPIPPGITVISPFVLPGKSLLSLSLNKAFFLPLLAFTLTVKGIRHPAVWTYLATSSSLRMIRLLQPSFLLYDSVFDISLNPHYPRDSADAEKKIIARADVILTDNRYLFKKYAELKANVHFVPPGVDAPHFLKEPPSGIVLAADIKKPRICFFGGIDSLRLDLDLIAYVARNRPGWSLVLLGPVIKTDIRQLLLRNVYFRKAVAYEALPAYLAEMDCLMLPYKIIPFSRSLFPAKLFECLATGKPVVATPLEALRSVEAGAVRIAGNRDEFISALEEALTNDTGAQRQNRLRIARENSWDCRFKEIRVILEKQLTI